MEVIVKVNGQKMLIESNSLTLAPGSQEFVKFIFDLSEDWDGLKVFAQFSQDGVGYNIYLDEFNSVYLPHEIMKGDCLLSLYGTGVFRIATTCAIKLYICDNGYISDAQGVEVTQSLYQQILDEFAEQLANNNYSVALTGTPTAPTATLGDVSTQIANTEFVSNAITESISGITAESIAEAISGKADIASPALTGTPTAPTAPSGTDSTQIATTAFVNTAIDELVESGINEEAINSKADINSPNFTGTPTAPTAPLGTGNTQIATTAFVNNALSSVIANNLTTISEGYALDARQGKVIVDSLGDQVVYALNGTTLTITSK